MDRITLTSAEGLTFDFSCELASGDAFDRYIALEATFKGMLMQFLEENFGPEIFDMELETLPDEDETGDVLYYANDNARPRK
ncbi:hypothetical protein E4191_05720 [Paracoccus liaowanqingii]|uniref:Uncharacterized protein n=1 Tax=Paracoccus liaowanqingii TaxID=2560053 RepID=A0A4P7HJE5_9RHOB|nr:hypothetical protein [Paracoccus liaowanqingii]QBX34269.1 hypothetical protein E4191_05720 [Paracoccus liaowanqingii]